MSLSVYIAGSSRAVDQIDGYRQRLRAAGLVCNSDWIDAVRKEAAAGKTDHDLTLAEMQHYAREDLAAIDRSSYLWLVVGDEPSVGMWVELGWALSNTLSETEVIVSGKWRGRIFTSLAARRFDDHDEALAWLLTEAS